MSKFDPLQKLLRWRAGSLSGAECLVRYEQAQRTESLVRIQGGFVCTNAECGMTSEQVELAQAIWPLALQLRFDHAKDREQHQVVCDDVDEMPNMTYVP